MVLSVARKSGLMLFLVAIFSVLNDSSVPAVAEVPQKSAGERFLEAVPDGGSISYDDFVKKVGNDVANLVGMVKPTKLSRNGNHVVLECPAGVAVKESGIEVVVQQQIECDMTAGHSSVQLDSVKGVTVKLPGGLGAADLNSVKLVKNADGSIKVSGTVKGLGFIPVLPFSFTLQP